MWSPQDRSRSDVAVLCVGLLAGAVASGCPGEDPPPDCENVEQASGDPSGLESCGFSLYRPRAVECAPASQPRSCDASDLGNGFCTSDEACGEGEQCLAGVGGRCECVRPCTTDEECGAGFACVCALAPGAISRCVPADCRSDADCGSDRRCQVDQRCVYGEILRLACHAEGDECRGTYDCEPGTCRYDVQDGRWRCIDDCVH